MRHALQVLVALTLLALPACGGDDDEGEPLTLAERVVQVEDAPGSKPDPVEQRQSTTKLDEFLNALHELAVDPDREMLTDLFAEAGFTAAIIDARFFGETHRQDAPHVFSSAIELESDDGAETTLEWLVSDSLAPCPRTCANRIAEFDVEGIPGARGVHRSQSAADIEARGRPGDIPFDSHEILFADGRFAYSVRVNGPPGSVSEQQALGIATALYDRISS